MASRILSDSLLTTRNRQSPAARAGLSRVRARRVMALCAAIGLLLFIYVVEVSEGTTTAFDIDQMQLEYSQWQESNLELEREIAALESPPHVLRYAASHGMVPTTDVTYLRLQARPQ